MSKKQPLPQYILEKPNFSNLDPKKVVQALTQDNSKYRKLLENSNQPDYIYWDKFRYKNTSENLSVEEKWYLIRQFRNVSATETEIRAENGEYFKWTRLSNTDEYFHKIDMLAGGKLIPQSDFFNSSNRQIFINRGIIEEAIASSQLEGAHTSRAVAKKMLMEKRAPRNESEHMILNNYTTMTSIEKEYKKSELSLEMLYELHKKLTINTLDEKDQYRLRRNKDEIVVQGQIGNDLYITHVPPEEEFLDSEINNLINFANDKSDQKFLHPILKAIFLHFWIGYLHPFVDGNGRLARTLFYWYLIKKDYWAFMYLPISTTIKRAPDQYAKSYIYSEQDNLDITYFYDFNIHKIMAAIKDFEHYIDNKLDEIKQIEKLLSTKIVLNERQKQLIHYFISDENPSTTITSYASINSISRQTAATDLKDLQEVKLIQPRREGKFIRYYPLEDLLKTMKEIN